MAVIPLAGDRSAFDADNYPELHASDLAASAPVVHMPTAIDENQIAKWDGTKWVAGTVTEIQLQPILTMEKFEVTGTLSTGASGLRLYNRFGEDLTLQEVFISVGTAPTGASIQVDLKKDGVSILDSYAEIAISGFTGVMANITDPIWATGEYLSWEIIQVGSSVAGADLTIQVLIGKLAEYISVGAGSITISGGSALVMIGTIVKVQPGVLDLTQNAITVVTPATISLAVGSLTLTENAVTLVNPSIIPLQPGVVALSGSSLSVVIG